ncbi:MAG: peptidoglycan-associated lipoprotein Pal [Deltaproteobacteria bacterium]|jgi:peptidoglycan-associated lipoprotein|nr:peptidoglycan-associated lipoprotein Pal [Deltaproteobacteria bacterium]
MRKLLLVAALALILAPLSVGCSKPPQGGGDTTSGLTAADQRFLNEHVYFDFDRYNIRSDQISVLQDKVAYLNENPTVQAEIQGHADERGTEAYNLALGDRRAKAAYNYVVGQGVSGGRLATISYGEDRPLDLGDGESAWSRNRRAQFVLLGR